MTQMTFLPLWNLIINCDDDELSVESFRNEASYSGSQRLLQGPVSRIHFQALWEGGKSVGNTKPSRDWKRT